MATKYYIESVSPPRVLPPSPGAEWEHATLFVPGATGYVIRRMNTTKQSTAMASVGATNLYDGADDTTNKDALVLVVVSKPLAAGTQTGSQALTAQFICREGTNSDNLFLTIKGYLIDKFGAAVSGGEFLPITRMAVTEMANSLTNRSFSATTAAGNITLQDGYRHVFEIGAGGTPTSGTGTNGHNSVIIIGDNSASDLPVNETATTQDNPWINFATDTFTFLAEVTGGSLVGVS